ncbi:MAG: peptidylprolyl isomerase [Putridiphycobacter sp.]|nr:peptidylprolyl isomerase [Putridiphycobacter sp.]
MAVIGKIQKNSYLLLIVIGLAMLAFIFTDSFKNIGGGVEPLASGEIAGVEIDEVELNKLEQTFVDRDRQNAGYQGNEYTAEDEQNSRDQAFNEIIRKNLMGQELSDLGLQVSTQELNDMITGNNIHPWISDITMFKNNIGEYSRDSVVKYLEGLQSPPNSADTAVYSRWQQAKIQWKNFEKELKDARSTDKFVSLVKKGMFANSLELKDNYRGNNETREISFVMQPYSSISEDEIGFSDDDIRAYYNKHKNDKIYQQTSESAEIEFVEFPVNYSQEDLALLKAEMNNLKTDFAETENNVYFMATKGEDKFYSDTTGFELGTTEEFVIDPKGQRYQYPVSIDSLVQASAEGDVIGPFETVNAEGQLQIAIAKVNGFESQKRAWVRHILISTNDRTEPEAKRLSDSLVRVIKSQNNFVELVTKFSDDPGSKANGGEYKWFKQGAMVPEFDKASFEGAKGAIQLVKTTYGYHIVEVLGREDRKLPKLAPIRKTVKPGIETIKSVENIAYEFINDVEASTDDSAFFKVAAERNLTPNYSKLFLSSRYVTGFNDHQKIQKFAFSLDSEEGDISSTIYDDSKIKVAVLKSKVAEGVPTFEAVKAQMRIPALREKQAAYYAEIMSGIKNINEVAQTIPNGKVQTATVKFGQGTIAGVGGKENTVVGSVFALDKEYEGAMLKPLKGEAGVFLVVLDKINEASIPEDYDFSSEKQAILNTRTAAADGNVMKALREKADIKDNRLKKAAQGR